MADLPRGTKVTLFLKEEQLEYLEERKLKDIIKKHSEFIAFNIDMMVEKTNEKEVTESDDEEETKKDEEKKIEEVTDDMEDKNKITDITDEEEKKKEKKKKKIKEVTHEFEHINKTRPIWMRKAADITKEEYAAF